MPVTTQARAWARVNWGRWIADCPDPYCGNAEALTLHQTLFRCQVCQLLAAVEWPADPDGIWDALTSRPRAATRNWYPDGHDEAVRSGLPHGQTPHDLTQETRDHEGVG